MDRPINLQGRWRVVDWQQKYDDGRTVQPMGPQVTGFLQYGRRHMVAMLTRVDRTPFKGGQWGASDEQKARAYDEFMAYTGTYDFDGTHVQHHVSHAICPDWIGGVQRRKVEPIDGGIKLMARLEDGTPEARTVIVTALREAEDDEGA